MYLRDGVRFVRNALGEITPNLWNSLEIVEHLNDSALRFQAGAQSIEDVLSFNTVSGYQEYALPAKVDKITGAAVYSGGLLPLRHEIRQNLQIGGKPGGLPVLFYTRRVIKRLADQNSINGLTFRDDPQQIAPRWVIGLWPVPAAIETIYIWFVPYHNKMIGPMDVVAIPDQYKREWCAYAIARCKEKEGDIKSANYWDQIHDSGVAAFQQDASMLGQDVSNPRWGAGDGSDWLDQGTSVILVDQTPGMQ